MKWEDAMRKYTREHALGQWKDLAVQNDVWMIHAEAFASWCNQHRSPNDIALAAQSSEETDEDYE